MAKLTNNHKSPKSECKIRVQKGFFGLRIKGYIPPAIMGKIVVHGKYWSPYEVQQYKLENTLKTNEKIETGWYFSNEALNVLIATGCKVFVNQ